MPCQANNSRWVCYWCKGALGVVEAIFNSGRSWHLTKLRLELAVHRLVRTILNRFSERDYSRLISFLNNPTKEVLSRISRNELLSLLLHLSLQAPHLILFSAFTFLRHTLTFKNWDSSKAVKKAS